MGFLAPLFLAGLAALSLPLLLHLVRRTPRGRQEFSSLMFLAPTPPRLTRRSRLDHVLLLLLRLSALALLAFAFARPFFREAAMLQASDLPRQRVAILIDSSGSMQRGDLWQEAIAQAERDLDDLAPHDDVALFTFSDRLETVVGFSADPQAFNQSTIETVRQRLRSLKPSWGTTDLGAALATLAAELDASSDVQQSLVEPRIVLISDFQRGSRTEALQAYEWPGRVHIAMRALSLKQPTNAYAQLLRSDAEAAGEDGDLRVRVSNVADSTGDQFYLRWTSEKPAATEGPETAVYVPPGQNRVVRLPRPENNLTADRIVLRGDDQPFDNTYFVTPPRKQEVVLLYAGADAADDPEGLQYYLRLAATSDPLRHVDIRPLEGDAFPGEGWDSGARKLVVASRPLSRDLIETLRKFVADGGMLLLAPRDMQAAQALPALFNGVELTEPSAKRSDDDFFLLGEIDFRHPLFASFASPRYSDFTKIHFWSYRPVKVDNESDARALARFDDGHPWILERTIGKGRVLALTSGWHPDDSQLALSTKFVPLIGSLLDLACGNTKSPTGVLVNDPVAIPPAAGGVGEIRLPDGRLVKTAASSATFDQTDRPGIYEFVAGGALAGTEDFRFAVNLAASESDTAPLNLEQLEQLGVKLGDDLTAAERLDRVRQQRDTELESRQKVWRWLLVACLGLLILETWLAGRASRPQAPVIPVTEAAT